MNLTFGEQVKVILSRKGMTIKELAGEIEQHTGKKMSRQNLTQRLGRDNFQERDMRMIANILGCPLKISMIYEDEDGGPKGQGNAPRAERDITIGELVDSHKELEEMESMTRPPSGKEHSKGWKGYLPKRGHKDGDFAKGAEEDGQTEDMPEVFGGAPEREDDENLELGELNEKTGHEYETNSVRAHPKRIGYVQVYNRQEHKWTDMTEWAFLGYQERKKALLGRDYEPPIYLD